MLNERKLVFSGRYKRSYMYIFFVILSPCEINPDIWAVCTPGVTWAQSSESSQLSDNRCQDDTRGWQGAAGDAVTAETRREEDSIPLVSDHHPRLYSKSVVFMSVNTLQIKRDHIIAILFFSYVNQRSRYISVDLPLDAITIRTGSWFDNNTEEDLNDRPIIGDQTWSLNYLFDRPTYRYPDPGAWPHPEI